MNGLVTDLYQLTMAAGYVAAGKNEDRATFELFIRRLPANRNYVLAAGLAQAVDYLLNLKFDPREIDYLRGLPQFAHPPSGFFDRLHDFRFTGDLFAVPEGTPVFGGEPIATIRAPLIEAQIVETYLLSAIAFQSMIATKAARVVEAAGQATVVEFGTRRAHSPEAGVLAGRAAYIGGCIGTSNVAAGFRYGVPVFGTAAHSWVQAFPTEGESFRQLQKLLGERTIHLIDTYDTIEGARQAASLGRPLWGVRLDSGNLFELARTVRAILDGAGLTDAKIMATGDLNEHKILELAAAGAPIDAYGVGTDLATSSDAPNLAAVYKLVELESGGVKRYTAKYSEQKHTLPGAKQVFRFADHDVIALEWECLSCPCGGPVGEALLRPVILHGRLVEPMADVHQVRAYAAESLKKLPMAVRSLAFEGAEAWSVEYSTELKSLNERVRQTGAEVPV
jgi:nicotinate phosphoribosyltransferase